MKKNNHTYNKNNNKQIMMMVGSRRGHTFSQFIKV